MAPLRAPLVGADELSDIPRWCEDDPGYSCAGNDVDIVSRSRDALRPPRYRVSSIALFAAERGSACVLEPIP
jgi:hypothetical protein